MPLAKPLPRVPRSPPLAEPPRPDAEEFALPPRPGAPVVRTGRGVVSFFGVCAFEETVAGGLSTKEVSVVLGPDIRLSQNIRHQKHSHKRCLSVKVIVVTVPI